MTEKMKTTRTLNSILKDVDDESQLNAYLDEIDHHAPRSFRTYFLSLEKVKPDQMKELRDRSGIERTYFYHILNGRKEKPGRDKILRLCLAARLSDDETRRALEAGGCAVQYSRSRRDAVITYALHQGLDAMHTNLLLAEYELEELQ